MRKYLLSMSKGVAIIGVLYAVAFIGLETFNDSRADTVDPAIPPISTVLIGDYPDHVNAVADDVLRGKASPDKLRGAIDLWDSLQKGREIEIKAPDAPGLEGVKPGEIIKVKIPKVDAETALDLGVCIRGEADTNVPDYSPIAFTLLRRMTLYNLAAKKLGRKPRTYRDQIRAYCQIFNRDAALYDEQRRVDIRSSTFDDPLHGTKEEWAALEDFIYSWSAGAIKDPCPSALIWGGREGVDPIPDGWIRIPCGGASNRFQRRAK